MINRSGSQIREDFLRFFEGKVSEATGQGHRRVHSSSLVPVNDPTLLFTNAGMNQFKDVFLGNEKRDYTRAVSSQKCVRAGGKHNDLENVGFTRRHHTFFEMLGNFSFGDYFKKDAIAYAWELLTSNHDHCFGIDPSRLYVTIFEGDAKVPRDDEAERFWIEIGVPKERIFGMSAKDNFWQMGDTGPCGPCSEIFYDMGIEAAEEAGVDKPFPQDDQRYVEVWNLVFMQFDRSSDGTLTPLPKPSIDTGMGLERIAAVLQGVLSNFETDLFTPLILKAAELAGLTGAAKTAETVNLASKLSTASDLARSMERGSLARLVNTASLRIIADHARCATFLISDGVLPSNEGRGYVLRKILRRGIRHGRVLGQEKPFMHEMVFAVRDEMQVAYPELKESAQRVSKVVLAEEEQFARVMERGFQELQDEFAAASERDMQNLIIDFCQEHGLTVDLEQLKSRTRGLVSIYRDLWDTRNYFIGDDYFNEKYESEISLQLGSIFKWGELTPELAQHIRKSWFPKLPGRQAFRLYETFGMPLDFMVDAARDAGIEFDQAGFEAAKLEEQQRARASWKGGSQKSAAPVYRELPKTEFKGYSALRVDGAKVLALVKDGVGVPELKAGELGEVVLDATSFYADSGGQVGDVGWLYSGDHNLVVAEVSGATKPVQGVFAHKVRANQTIAVGDSVDTVVDGATRAATTRNHTGTHLLHAALREVLGKHVKQAGSLNDATRLRFDFSHFTGVAEEELREVEEIVNRQVMGNTKVETLVDVPIDVAVNELGAMALFGEKYGEKVRVVKIGDFSTELCGGIHTGATGEIGLIKVVGEGSVSSGVRRVEAVSGTGALHEFRRDFDVAKVVGAFVGSGAGSSSESVTPAEALRARIAAQEEEMKKLRRELDVVRMKAASSTLSDASASAVEVKGVKVLAQRVDGVEKAQLRELVDSLRIKLGSGVVVLGAAVEGKVSLIVGVTKDLTARVQAGKVVGLLAAQVGGKGGGRPDLAEAGGSDVGSLDSALQGAAEVVGGLLG
ncbi:alanine--tRNA ligase [Tunturiibacter gelidoferens]|uniref:Alanine--tRNA ligase n=1 Tax=Tunturiibacter lichenicola TaxID=2051959 RepID=A0A7Y9NJQ3_9BACT|nr:alanine--tRNA ligase [Edaphobacter lichenicola]NYF50497.1 alanyl-tRNA synthetase [Edaphobacter lichenicola]